MFISTKLTIVLSALAFVANSSVVAADLSSSRSLYADPGYDTGYMNEGEDCNERSACKKGAMCSYWTEEDMMAGHKRCCPTARTTEEWLHIQSSCTSTISDCRDNQIFYYGGEYCGNMNFGECSHDVQCSSGQCENGRCYTPDYEKCELAEASYGTLYDPNDSSCRPNSACAVVKADVFQEGTCNFELSNHQSMCVPLGTDSDGDPFPKAGLDKPCVTSQFCEGADSVCCYMGNDSNEGVCKRMEDCNNVADCANVALNGLTIKGFSGSYILSADGKFAFFTPAGTAFDCN